ALTCWAMPCATCSIRSYVGGLKDGGSKCHLAVSLLLCATLEIRRGTHSIVFSSNAPTPSPLILKSVTSGKAGGLQKVEPLKAVDAVNRSKRFGCEPPTGGPAYHRSI